MTKGFFGGNPDVAHWSVSIKFDKTADKAKINADLEALKKAGIKSKQYFQFRVTDLKGKARQKVKAIAEAERIEQLTGIKMAVHEGFFM